MQKDKQTQAFCHNELWVRDGPKPLALHMNLAMTEKTVGSITDEQLKAFLQGVKKYQAHSFKRQMPAAETLWHHKGVSLSYWPAKGRHKEGNIRQALFIIPSLINRSDIFDLLPEKSFVRWMTQKGIDVYLLDWDRLDEEDPACCMNGLFTDYIFPALHEAQDHFAAIDAQGRLYGLGYCMGGTLLTAALCHKESGGLKGAVLVASPWDFHAGDQSLANRVKALKINAAQTLAQDGKPLPVDMVQAVFASLMPAQTVKKFAQFQEMDDGSPEEKIFIAAEDWLNNGRDIPHHIARGIIFDWYDRNLTAAGQWEAAGTEVRPEKIQIPVLLLASKRDKLVPYHSTKSLAQKIKGARLTYPDSGHIGFMAGKTAEIEVWQTIYDWLQEQIGHP